MNERYIVIRLINGKVTTLAAVSDDISELWTVRLDNAVKACGVDTHCGRVTGELDFFGFITGEFGSLQLICADLN